MHIYRRQHQQVVAWNRALEICQGKESTSTAVVPFLRDTVLLRQMPLHIDVALEGAVTMPA
jgi:hypothetical protein